jgi:hypothetical protein
LAMTSNERGLWPSYVGKLWDATTMDSFKSVSAVDRWVQIFRLEVWDAAKGRRMRWPSDAGTLIVFSVDVATVGHSASESTNGARSHRFLLNNQECVTVTYLARQLSVFCKPD